MRNTKPAARAAKSVKPASGDTITLWPEFKNRAAEFGMVPKELAINLSRIGGQK